jgi:hypothetical protein
LPQQADARPNTDIFSADRLFTVRFLAFRGKCGKFVKLFTHGTKVLSLTYRGLQANLPRTCSHYFSPDLVS